MSESIFDLCKNGNEEGVRSLIAADRALINAPDKVSTHQMFKYYVPSMLNSLLISHLQYVQDKMTPLMHAAKNGKTAIAQLLLEEGAEKDAQNKVSLF